MKASTAVDIYPPLGLVVRTNRLELRLVNSFEEAAALADVAVEGIHDPSFMPFATPWTDGTPEQVRARVLAHALSLYPCETPNVWKLPFAVREASEPLRPIGVMSLTSRDQQGVEAVTGSWLGKAYQGRGYGKEMRNAVLALAFDGMGFSRAVTDVREGNVASQSVTLSLGYTHANSYMHPYRGVESLTHSFVLDRSTWERTRSSRHPVTWEGVDRALRYFTARN